MPRSYPRTEADLAHILAQPGYGLAEGAAPTPTLTPPEDREKGVCVALNLPFPPSLNHHWRILTPQRLVTSPASREYFRQVAQLVLLCRQASLPLAGSLELHLDVYPPDRRRRDLDNLGKAVLDALQHAGVYHDDSQIDDLRYVRHAPSVPGYVVATIAVRHGRGA